MLCMSPDGPCGPHRPQKAMHPKGLARHKWVGLLVACSVVLLCGCSAEPGTTLESPACVWSSPNAVTPQSLPRFMQTSLKDAFKWDEEKFGREYDLTQFNVVAVSFCPLYPDQVLLY